jgi:hypothetical protein
MFPLFRRRDRARHLREPAESGKVAAMSPLAATLFHARALNAPGVPAAVNNNCANNNANPWRARA